MYVSYIKDFFCCSSLMGNPTGTCVAFNLEAFSQTSAIKCNCYYHRVEVEFIQVQCD